MKKTSSKIIMLMLLLFISGCGQQIQQGPKGDKGDKGDTGNSITEIVCTNTSNNVDTYTIYFSDGSTSTFTVTNGVDGSQGIQGVPGKDGHTPEITIIGGYWYIDGINSKIKAEGLKGDKGDAGLSAYEIYLKYHPEYDGSEEQWTEDLVNGNLREKYSVTFNSSGGSSVQNQKVSYGHLVSRPYDPTREGYIFEGWFLNGEMFPFNSYQVFDDLTLVAHWKSNAISLTLNPDGGEVEYNTKKIIYGTSYVLPTPTRKNYVFEGWYYNNELCPLSGIWDFSKIDITLTAIWSGTQAVVSQIDDKNVTNGFAKMILKYGEYYHLPVPNILTGDSFIGWCDEEGNIYTDSEGYSLRPSLFKNDISLKAIYYVNIYTIGDLIKLAGYQSGSIELTRTYVLANDLNFTGMENESIRNFEGVLDGNGHKIVGMSNSLFKSIGSSSKSSNNVIIKNLDFEQYGGQAIIENVLNVDSLNILNVKIKSFIKDENNHLDFDGILANVGDLSMRIRPVNLSISNCHILDEFTSINSGFIGNLNFFKNVDISKSSNFASCANSAFISSDSYSMSSSEEMEKFYEALSRIQKPRRDDYVKAVAEIEKSDINSNISITLCANYGNCSNFASVSAGSSGLYKRDYKSSSSVTFETNKHNVNIVNCANYGNLSSSFFMNTMGHSTTETNFKGQYGDTTYIYTDYYMGYGKRTGGFCIRKCLNFGKINKLFGNSGFNASYIFNAGETAAASAYQSYGLENCYEVLQFTNIDEKCVLNISSLEQVNSDFFINTFGLDGDEWDLSYIKIDDKYGRPTIKFN